MCADTYYQTHTPKLFLLQLIYSYQIKHSFAYGVVYGE